MNTNESTVNVSRRTTLMMLGATFLGGCATQPTSSAEPEALVASARTTLSNFIRDPDQTWIQDNLNRSRGILIKASRGEVTGNRITHGWMAGVLVSPEFWWFEAASASDVVIRHNIIEGCRRTTIEVVAPGGDGQPLAAGAHRDITVIGNRVTGGPWPALHVTSTAGLRIRDNDWGDPPAAGGTPVALEHCADVEGQR